MELRFRRSALCITMILPVIATATAIFPLRVVADDVISPLQIDLGKLVARSLEEVGPNLGETRKPSVDVPPVIEIGGFAGGLEIPDNVKQMMKSAEEIQAIRTKHEATLDLLIATAKKLEDSEGLAANALKVAALAKEVELLRAQIDAKQKEMMTQLGGGPGLFGGGEVDATDEPFGANEAEVEIFPRNLLPKFDP